MLSNYNMNISRDANEPMLQWWPQHPIQGKDIETSCLIEYPSFKKRRICENFFANPSILVAMEEVASGSFKARQCGPKWKEFADDSKKLCRMFCNGRNCSYGGRCRFLHVIPDKFRDISMINIVPGAGPVSQNRGSGELDCKGSVGSLSVGNEGVPKQASWKTKLCNNWKMTGGCAYGKACCYAHGETELQKLHGHFALESWSVPAFAWKDVHKNGNGIGNHIKQQLQETKGSLKRKEIVKLCDIYADWIEDMTTLPTPSYK
ncbi:hypothetical protein SCA6_019405 [Theobroma cacao]